MNKNLSFNPYFYWSYYLTTNTADNITIYNTNAAVSILIFTGLII